MHISCATHPDQPEVPLQHTHFTLTLSLSLSLVLMLALPTLFPLGYLATCRENHLTPHHSPPPFLPPFVASAFCSILAKFLCALPCHVAVFAAAGGLFSHFCWHKKIKFYSASVCVCVSVCLCVCQRVLRVLQLSLEWWPGLSKVFKV